MTTTDVAGNPFAAFRSYLVTVAQQGFRSLVVLRHVLTDDVWITESRRSACLDPIILKQLPLLCDNKDTQAARNG